MKEEKEVFITPNKGQEDIGSEVKIENETPEIAQQNQKKEVLSIVEGKEEALKRFDKLEKVKIQYESVQAVYEKELSSVRQLLQENKIEEATALMSKIELFYKV